MFEKCVIIPLNTWTEHWTVSETVYLHYTSITKICICYFLCYKIK